MFGYWREDKVNGGWRYAANWEVSAFVDNVNHDGYEYSVRNIITGHHFARGKAKTLAGAKRIASKIAKEN